MLVRICFVGRIEESLKVLFCLGHALRRVHAFVVHRLAVVWIFASVGEDGKSSRDAVLPRL